MWSPPPQRVDTERLVLRCWQPSDAPRLKAAIDASLPELLPWIPWAVHEPSPLAAVEQRLITFRDTFAIGPNWAFGLFDREEAEVLGGIGLHARVGPTALEIGYWVRTDVAGRGYATEAAGALTPVALAMGAGHLEIHCDPLNLASAGVAAKLGYRHAATRPRDFPAPGGERRDTMIWVWPRDAEPYQPPAEGA